VLLACERSPIGNVLLDSNKVENSTKKVENMKTVLIKVRGLDIYIPPLTGKPWPAAVYNSKWRTDSDRQWHKWRSASSGSPLPEWTDFGPRSLQPDRPTYAAVSHTMAFSQSTINAV